MNKQDPRYEKFQSLLKDMRTRQGIRQQELAETLGRPQSYVSKYESGERNIDLIELIEITKALNIEPEVAISDLVSRLSD